MTERVLYSYWRSTAAYRVRIALNLKGLEYRVAPVSLVDDGGEHLKPAFAALNPQRRVPFYQDDRVALGQSMAILDYLEERFREPALLPPDEPQRGRARQIANIIACDIHPLNNMGVLNYLTDKYGIDANEKGAWYSHWVQSGFDAIERILSQDSQRGSFCVGESPGIAELCLVPQLYNAHRFNVDVSAYPLIRNIAARCETLDAFATAHPSLQPDAAS